MFATVWGVGKLLPEQDWKSLVILVAVGAVVYLFELVLTKDTMLLQGAKMLKNKFKKA